MIGTIPLVVASMLAIAAWRDVLTRTIPDHVCLGIAILGLVARFAAGWVPLLTSAVFAASVFGLLLTLAMRGWLGGGDVKLTSALVLGLPPAAAWDFMQATVLAGGVLGLGYLAGPHIAPRLRPAGAARPIARMLAVEARRLRRGGPLPYGVAIAVGGAVVLFAGS